MRRLATAALALLALLAPARPAAAQDSAAPAGDRTPTFEFIPAYAFHLTAEHLSSDDQQFDWEANFGGELDVVDYGLGRARFEANYQVIMGDEFRAFDPNQGNYVLALASSLRYRRIEVAGVFYHQSRHLSDRPKRLPVAWNMIGGRVTTRLARRRATIDAQVDLRGVVQQSFVDYQWELAGDVRGRVPVAPRVAAVFGVQARAVGVDGSQNRGTQHAYRADAGIRLQGTAGAVELFVAAERRLDPYPLEFGVQRWVSVGMRLLSR